MKYWRYNVYRSIPSLRPGGKRKWNRIAAGFVLTPANQSCIARAEEVAVQQGLATREEFQTPLNSSYAGSIHRNGASAKVVSVGPVEK